MNKTSLALAVSLVVLLTACGKQESATPEAPAPTAPEVAAPVAPEAAMPAAPEAAAPEAAAPAAAAEQKPEVQDGDLGKKVFGSVCTACHTMGIAGAPKLGDKVAWGPRIAQGTGVLYKHALEGFTGTKGMMPPRGGGMTLSDAEVKAAVDYMVAQSK
jgi:cytochrome c5